MTQKLDSALFEAIDQGDCKAFTHLLEKGANPNAKDEYDEETVLVWAIYEEKIEFVKLLLDAGANLEGRAHGGTTPLIAAAAVDIEMVRLLLNAGAAHEPHSDDGSTALLEAVAASQIATVQLLLDVGADTNVCSTDRGDNLGDESPLMLAAQDGDVAMAKVLLEHGADPNRFSDLEAYTALHIATRNSSELCELLIAYGADINARLSCLGSRDTPLEMALNSFSYGSSDGSCAAVLMRETEKRTPGAIGCPVHAAAYVGDIAKLERIGSSHFEARDASGRTPLHWAAGKPNELVACSLLGLAILPNETRRSPHSQTEVMSLLVNKGADIDSRDYREVTPLLESLQWSQVRAARWLIENGAHVDVEDSVGWTPLQLSAVGGHAELIGLLLERGANIDTARMGVWTPLTFAIHGKKHATAALLLERGASVVASGKPLHRAIDNGLIRIAEMLVNCGADTKALNDEGKTALQRAQEMKNARLIALLQS